MAKITLLTALGLAVHGAGVAGSWRERVRERIAERQASQADATTNAAGATGSFALPGGATIDRDIAYGSDPAHKVDVYRPARAQGAPVIFMVHGGGWRHGDKGTLRAVKNKVTHWVGKGFVFVSVNYRLLPAARPLEQANDVAKALAFVQSKAGSWGADPGKIVLMGHSAGAHLVSLITADPGIATRQGTTKPWLGTVALDSAAYDIVEIMERRHYRLYDQAFADDRNVWREASPTHRLSTAPVPMLLVCSTRRDDACPPAKTFAAKATSLGGRVTVLPVDMSHGEINDLLGVRSPYTEAVENFIDSVVKK